MAHIVIASGAAWAAERTARRLARQSEGQTSAHRQAAAAGSLFDYRLVALGALLPDLIDKPLARLVLADRVEDDHLLAHTLVFALILAVPGLYLARQGDPRLISLACGALVHLLCDPVLREPRTLFWPLYGTTFHSTKGLGNGLAVNLTLDLIAGSVAAVVLRRLWLRDRLWVLAWTGWI